MLNMQANVNKSMSGDTIEMPKSLRERLLDLPLKGSMPIEPEKRKVFSSTITTIHRDTKKLYTIRTIKETGEIRVWRLK